jgi:uncharacterized membrane protein YqjE
MASQDEKPSVVNSITRVLEEIVHLFQTEIRLVRTELNEKMGQLANGGVFIGAAMVLILGGFILFLLAIVQFLVVAGLPEEWGLLLVGILAAAGGGLLLSRGIQTIKTTNLVPDRSIDQIRADVATVREHIT